MQPAGKHPKHEFQVERLAFFSDAVFAIAITLLVIEIRVPHNIKTATYEEIAHELHDMRYEFVATVLSFLLIAVNWVRHHILFKYIHSYNSTILRTSLAILLPTIFFPFTTAFYAEAVNNMEVFPLALQLFLLNNILVGIATYYMYWLITRRYADLAYPMTDKDRNIFSNRLFWMTIGMTLMLLLSLISISLIGYGATPWIVAIIYNRFKSKKVKTKTTHAR